MKVKELIARLQQHDPENEVVLSELYDITDNSEFLDKVFEVCHLEKLDAMLRNGEKFDEVTVIYFSL